HVVGGQAYYWVSEILYGGSADYAWYYGHGKMYAEALLAGRPDESGSFWLESGEWCCTAFTIRTSGVFLAALDLSIYSSFLLFSLIGYAGVIGFAMAFVRAFPSIPIGRYLVWIVYFPSLWYWPSALGKDALMLAGIGLATMGYVGKRGRIRWLPVISGATLVFAVRPQVAIVLSAAFAAGYWLSSLRRFSLIRLVQSTVMTAAVLVVVVLAGETLGTSLSDAADVTTYLEARSSAAATGGTAIEGASGALAPLLGVVTVLFRPFLWEVNGAAALVAALEVLVLWFIAWHRRRQIAGFIRAHRDHRLFWMAAAFIVLYAASLGIAAGNLGLVARQRVHVFPFVFVFFAGLPTLRHMPGLWARPRPRANQVSTVA
ncbi:MAG: hypothetical protein AAGK21_07010, partial [Bacteroidota bacterium]